MLLILLLFLSTVFCNEIFYKIFENKNNAKIRGIISNEPILAIATEANIIFGNLNEIFEFIQTSKIQLTQNLMGNSELLEFKFITKIAVIICNNMECGICNNRNVNGTCRTIAAFPIKSVNAEFSDEILFLRIVHEKNNASFYSFKYGTLEIIGQKYNDPSNEYKSLYSFSHGNYIYFVNEIKRYDDFALCLKDGKNNVSHMNNDIVITQICKNDQSEKIISAIDITVSCGEHANSNKSYISYDSIGVHRNIFQNNVTGITYFSKDSQLYIALQDSPNFSFLCKFKIDKIEEEFCKTWNYCQNNNVSSNDFSSDIFKKCIVKKQDTKGCLKYYNTRDYLTCNTLTNSSNYCDKRNTLNKERKYKWMESRAIVFGENIQEVFYDQIYGKMISSKNQLYVTKMNRLIKSVNEKYHFLEGLPTNNNLRMITTWDSKNGIIYVDPLTKDTVYFKDIICSGFSCVDVLHSTSVKCQFCEKHSQINGLSACNGRTETYCGPLWQKVDSTSIAHANHNLVVAETNNLKIVGEENLNVQCFPLNATDFQDCTYGIDKRLTQHFTTSLPSKQSVSNKFIIGIIVAVGFLVIASIIVAAVLSLYKRKKKRLNKNQYGMELTDFNNTTKSPHLYLLGQHSQQSSSYMNSHIGSKKITILKELGSGHFGIVSLALYKDGEVTKKVAVKTFQCSNADVIKEIETLSLCKHPNIVTFIAWTEINFEMYIIIEHMRGGDLESFLRNPKNTLIFCEKHSFFFSTIFLYIFQILDAMIYLSDKKILHRDLAARNCLLNENYKILKISDFGLARKLDVNYEYRPENVRALPFRWLPLEALINGKFTRKGDIWSFGVLIWEIFERGSRPYSDLINFADLLTFLECGCRLSCPQYAPQELYEIMKKCWNEIPEDRPTFKELKAEIKEIYDCLKADYEKNEVHEYQNQPNKRSQSENV